MWLEPRLTDMESGFRPSHSTQDNHFTSINNRKALVKDKKGGIRNTIITKCANKTSIPKEQ